MGLACFSRQPQVVIAGNAVFGTLVLALFFSSRGWCLIFTQNSLLSFYSEWSQKNPIQIVPRKHSSPLHHHHQPGLLTQGRLSPWIHVVRSPNLLKILPSAASAEIRIADPCFSAHHSCKCGYLSDCSLSVSSNQSDHSPLTSLINKRSPPQSCCSLETGCYYCTHTVKCFLVPDTAHLCSWLYRCWYLGAAESLTCSQSNTLFNKEAQISLLLWLHSGLLIPVNPACMHSVCQHYLTIMRQGREKKKWNNSGKWTENLSIHSRARAAQRSVC